ncbi:hypothetical protein [Streptomyces rhizosphaericus]|uniref:hypothetical protein n=1 Tax=Streptomyces rhizosphaericus TaxID=114699 RepID=UPI000A3BFB60|nr:hypothetical protein [Streptomyces rhizosphaericus]
MNQPAPATDDLGTEFVAVGLIRATADGMLPGSTSTVHQRVLLCAQFVEDWLGGPDAGARGEMRTPLIQVLDALARCTAAYLVAVHHGSTAEAEAWLAGPSAIAEAAAPESGDPHPVEFTALTLVRIGIEAMAVEDAEVAEEQLDRFEADRTARLAGHCDRYVRESHVSEDAYGLVLCSARLAATVLVHLCGRDRAMAVQQLDHQAAELMADQGRQIPVWMPDDPAGLGSADGGTM